MFRKCKRNVLLSSVFYLLTTSEFAYAEDHFDSELIEDLNDSGEKLDLSIFNKKGGQLPGSYYTSVFLNKGMVAKKYVNFVDEKNMNELAPLLTKEDYLQFGIINNATPEFAALKNDEVIENIGNVIPDAFYKYIFNESKLQISVPQIYLNQTAQGDVPQSLWDDGITSLFTNYYYSGSNTTYNDIPGIKKSSYLNLRSGINYGPWRFRNYSIYNHSDQMNDWKNVSNYIERDIKALKSQLTIGDNYTNSAIFDSFSFRGVQLSSDEAMQPSSQRGFAPKVRGIAQSNAIVTIRQNGVIIRQENVAAGPFAIDDLYPTSTSGDLEVTIEEAGGSKRVYIQPFSSVPIMLREGNMKYSMAAGRYRSEGNDEKEPNFMQGVLSYGISNETTLYGGYILSDDYKSFLGGIGWGLGNWGSLSLDANIAKTNSFNSNNTGSSLRAQYSKDILETGTNFTLASYRYSTENFKDFPEANRKNTHNPYYLGSKRDKFQVNLTQNLGDDLGSVYLNAYQQRYWNNGMKSRNMELGYSNYYNSISYSVGYSYADNQYGDKSNQLLSVSVSIPIGSSSTNTNLNLSTVMEKRSVSSAYVGVNGQTLEDNALAYNIRASHASNSQDSHSLSSSLNYKTPYGEYQVGYAHSDDSKKLSYSASGSAVVHPYGITLGQSMGETAALVRAVDAKNIKINGNTGVYTNGSGYAIVPYVSPYDRNTLSLDTATMGENTDILSSVNTIVPTRGAIVLSDYPTRIGNKVLVTLSGKKVPFGAVASMPKGQEDITGIVDEGQVVYLSGVPDEGNIQVSWGSGHCTAPYKLSSTLDNVSRITAVCN